MGRHFPWPLLTLSDHTSEVKIGLSLRCLASLYSASLQKGVTLEVFSASKKYLKNGISATKWHFFKTGRTTPLDHVDNATDDDATVVTKTAPLCD